MPKAKHEKIEIKETTTLEKGAKDAREPVVKKQTDEIRESASEEAAPLGEAAETNALTAPEPIVIGDDRIEIGKNDIYRREDDEVVSIEMDVKNISEEAIGSIIFEADLYDINGSTLDRIAHKALDFKPGASRRVKMQYSGMLGDKVRSYCVKIATVKPIPQSKATGSDKVSIIRHYLNLGPGDMIGIMAGIDMSVKNITDTTIASVLFKAEIYDIEGNVLETVNHQEVDIKPGASRGICIKFKQQNVTRAKAYKVETGRATTTDAEKVVLRLQDRHRMYSGEEEVNGIVKNISNKKTDAALVTSFFDKDERNIGTKIVILRDIDPGATRKFLFTFSPVVGEKAKRCEIAIGELME